VGQLQVGPGLDRRAARLAGPAGRRHDLLGARWRLQDRAGTVRQGTVGGRRHRNGLEQRRAQQVTDQLEDSALPGEQRALARLPGEVDLLDRDLAVVDQLLGQQVQVGLGDQGVQTDTAPAVFEGLLEVDLDLQVVGRPEGEELERVADDRLRVGRGAEGVVQDVGRLAAQPDREGRGLPAEQRGLGGPGHRDLEAAGPTRAGRPGGPEHVQGDAACGERDLGELQVAGPGLAGQLGPDLLQLGLARPQLRLQGEERPGPVLGQGEVGRFGEVLGVGDELQPAAVAADPHVIARQVEVAARVAVVSEDGVAADPIDLLEGQHQTYLQSRRPVGASSRSVWRGR
jgi:hypothetical protein